MALTPGPTARVRRAAAAVAFAGAIALSGCTSTFTAQPYTPGVGVNVDQGDIKARALVLVIDSPDVFLTGQLVAQQKGDTLTKVEGVALDQHDDEVDGGQLEFNAVNVPIKANQSASLTDTRVAASAAKVEAGLTARIKLTFEKSGTAEIVVPVVNKKHPDYKTYQAPTEAATPGA